jgi:hypothetical protein
MPFGPRRREPRSSTTTSPPLDPVIGVQVAASQPNGFHHSICQRRIVDVSDEIPNHVSALDLMPLQLKDVIRVEPGCRRPEREANCARQPTMTMAGIAGRPTSPRVGPGVS